VKRLVRIAVWLFDGILVFVLLVAAFTQTQIFRDRLRAVALSNLDSLLNAQVHLGTLRGNLITGFEIDSISIAVDGVSVVAASRVDIRYNVFAIPGKTLSLSKIALFNPSFTLLRDRGGSWNFERMIRHRAGDTTAGEPFDWKVDLQELEVQHGTVVLLDSASLLRPGHVPPDKSTVEYHDFRLHDLNLVMAARLQPEEKHVRIASLSFVSDRPSVWMQRLALDVLVTPQGGQIDGLTVTTDRSDFTLKASLKNVNLMSGISLEQLRKCPVDLSLRVNTLDLSELQKFIPALDFLNGTVMTDLDITGEFGRITVKRFDLRQGASQLAMKGTVTNLHKPEDLMLDVKLTESTIDPGDLLRLMPRFDLPDYSAAGPVKLNASFTGRPLGFTAACDLESGAGRIWSPEFAMEIGGPRSLAYRGDVFMRDFNLAVLLGDPRFASRLTGTASINGEGVSVRQMNTRFSVAVDSSEFGDQPVTATRITMSAEDKKLRGVIHFSVGEMRGDIAGDLDESQPGPPTYSLDGDVVSLNLESFLHDRTYNSDLTLKLKARGSGLNWNDLTGDFVLDLSSSRYGEYQVDSGNVHLIIDPIDSVEKRLTIESNIADFVIAGAFDLPYLAKLAEFEVENVRGAVGSKLAPLDSSLAVSVNQKRLDRLTKELAARDVTMDANFALLLKNLEPLSIVTGNRTFNGTGTITGTVGGGFKSLNLETELDLDEFFYGNVESGILIEEGRLAMDVKALTPVAPLNNAALRLTGMIGSLHINREHFDSLIVDITSNRTTAQFSGRTAINENLRCETAGDARLSGDTVAVTFGRLEVAYLDYAWAADPRAWFELTRNGFSLHDLVMRRDSEEVSLNGSVAEGGQLEARLTGSHIDLNGLRYLPTKEKIDSTRGLFSGTAGLTLVAGGTLVRPWFMGSLSVDRFTYRGVPLGSLAGDVRYRDQSLSLHAVGSSRIDGTMSSPDMVVDGTIPINLSLVPVDSDRITDEPVDLTVRAENFQMGILDPFLPTFKRFNGLLKCDLTVKGSLRHPSYGGTASIKECSFLFLPNNIEYTFEGSFEAKGERLKVLDAALSNINDGAQGVRAGVFRISGDFALRDLHPGDFNLVLRGNLLVVKETTSKSSLEVSGNLFVEIGPAGLRFTGEIENSLLKGEVLVRNSSLVFPPTSSQVVEESALAVPVVVVDDTTRIVERRRRSAAERYFSRGRGSVSGIAEDESRKVPSVSFMDGMKYDLEIETTGGNTEIKMIFNPISAEELVATIDGRFAIRGDKTRWFGELTIQRAYYNFLKRFDAQGKIRYAGDFMNPELDVQATYRGRRTVQDSTGKIDERVVVMFKISGARQQPKVDYAMTIDDVDYLNYRGLKSNDIQSDAIQFIVYGTFPLTAAQKNEVQSDVERTLGLSVLTGATSLLTGTLSEFLRTQTGFISSVELSYGGGGKALSEAAEIRLSGVAWNGYWRYGGRILDDPLGNANFSLMYSLGTIFNAPSARNLMFELERRVEQSTLQSNDLKRVNSARLFYRFSF
jgi:hypothetical protein